MRPSRELDNSAARRAISKMLSRYRVSRIFMNIYSRIYQQQGIADAYNV